MYETNVFECQVHKIFEHKRSCNFYKILKEAAFKKSRVDFRYKKMKNNKRVKVLPKVIQKVYDKNPEMQEVINASKIEICSEEDTFPEQVFFIAFIIMAILEKNLSKSVQ